MKRKPRISRQEKKDLEIKSILDKLKNEDPFYEEKLLKIVKEELNKLKEGK